MSIQDQNAPALFCSTSPSCLILLSLDSLSFWQEAQTLKDHPVQSGYFYMEVNL